MNDFTPKIIFFCCDWNPNISRGLDENSGEEGKLDSRTIRTMCSGRIEPTLILQAFHEGADGVMIAGCPPGDCHYNTGNYKAKRRVTLLRKMLTQLGIESNRLRLEWVPDAEEIDFGPTVKGFVEEVRGLGPLGSNGKQRSN